MELTKALSCDEQNKVDQLMAEWMPWLLSMAVDQVKPAPFVELSALPSTPPGVIEGEEMAFRRGYQHGYSQAMDDLLKAGYQRNKAWYDVAQFFDKELHHWRYREPMDSIIDPPGYQANLSKDN
jgi:hypothetical protein